MYEQQRCCSTGRLPDTRSAMSAVELACRAWKERADSEPRAAVEVLRDLRSDSSATAKAVARRLRTYLVQAFLLSLPAATSPQQYLAWLSLACPVMDGDERAQHLLAYSRVVPRSDKKVARPDRRLRPARDNASDRHAAFDLVSMTMDEVAVGGMFESIWGH